MAIGTGYYTTITCCSVHTELWYLNTEHKCSLSSHFSGRGPFCNDDLLQMQGNIRIGYKNSSCTNLDMLQTGIICSLYLLIILAITLDEDPFWHFDRNYYLHFFSRFQDTYFTLDTEGLKYIGLISVWQRCNSSFIFQVHYIVHNLTTCDILDP